MDELDELIAYLQRITENLYYHMGQAEEKCLTEAINSQDAVLLNTAWINLENSIIELETLVQTMKIKRAAVAREIKGNEVSNMNLHANTGVIRKKAEQYYRQGDFYCSEAIVKAIKDEFALPLPDSIIAMASGFPVGMGGSGCTCGAIAGGIMSLGMFFGRTEPRDQKVNKTMQLAKELHDLFQQRHSCLCCRVLTRGMELGSATHMEQCVSFTGEVAEETAKIIIREWNS